MAEDEELDEAATVAELGEVGDSMEPAVRFNGVPKGNGEEEEGPARRELLDGSMAELF